MFAWSVVYLLFVCVYGVSGVSKAFVYWMVVVLVRFCLCLFGYPFCLLCCCCLFVVVVCLFVCCLCMFVVCVCCLVVVVVLLCCVLIKTDQS